MWVQEAGSLAWVWERRSQRRFGGRLRRVPGLEALGLGPNPLGGRVRVTARVAEGTTEHQPRGYQWKGRRGAWFLPLLVALLSACGGGGGEDELPAGVFSTKITDDRPSGGNCTDPTQLPNPTADLNNQPQAEVWIDVSEDGRLAACAKDYRYSPIDNTLYNNRVWNGLYLSGDEGRTWRNLNFQDSNPNMGITGITDGAYGLPMGVEVRLALETDPVVAFDRDGNLYTGALAYSPTFKDPSSIVASRVDGAGLPVPGTTHFLGLEEDIQLFNDKNWLTVARDAPVGETVVVHSWRLFSFLEDPPAREGGYIAVSADGGASFGAPIRLPIEKKRIVNNSQFYQPILGPDPVTGSRTLYVIFRTIADSDFSMAMHVIKSDIGSLPAGDTAALHGYLADPEHWTWLPRRLTGMTSYGSGGWQGSFRFSSFFIPTIDRQSGSLYVTGAVFDAASQGSQVVVSRSDDGGETWTTPKPVDYPGFGHQMMPAAAFHGGILSVVWYDSRNEGNFRPFAPIGGIDVYYAEMDSELRLRRVLRLTPGTQDATHRVFTRPQGFDRGRKRRGLDRLQPHDFMVSLPKLLGLSLPAGTQLMDAGGFFFPLSSGAMERGNGRLGGPGQSLERRTAERRGQVGLPADRSGFPGAACDPYGFIGDYIGLAADGKAAYAAWADLRDLDTGRDVCSGHDCQGGRNQNVYFARIDK